MNQNKMRTVTDVPDWGWYFEMSLLETLEIKFAGDLFVDYDSSSTHICVLSYISFKVADKELVPICYHGKAK